MTNLNRVLFMGRLTRDPELTTSKSGNTTICKWGMVSNRITGKGDTRKESACFIDVTAFGRTGEVIKEYVKKGELLFIEGRLDFSTWEDRNGGGKRSKLAVIAESFQFLPNTEREAVIRNDPPKDDIPF